jgi:hypothetical protein
MKGGERERRRVVQVETNNGIEGKGRSAAPPNTPGFLRCDLLT